MMERTASLHEGDYEPDRLLFGSRLLARLAEVLAGTTLLATAGFTYWLIGRPQQEDTLIGAPVVALLLVVNLLPAIVLLVLIGQRIARRRAARSLVGGGGACMCGWSRSFR